MQAGSTASGPRWTNHKLASEPFNLISFHHALRLCMVEMKCILHYPILSLVSMGRDRPDLAFPILMSMGGFILSATFFVFFVAGGTTQIPLLDSRWWLSSSSPFVSSFLIGTTIHLIDVPWADQQ